MRINIEDKLENDQRFRALVSAVGEIQAYGCCVKAFKVAQSYWFPNKKLIPKKIWRLTSIDPLFLELDLAIEKDDSIYVRGTEEQFAWLFQKINAGKKSAEARRKKFGSAQPSNEARTALERCSEELPPPKLNNILRTEPERCSAKPRTKPERSPNGEEAQSRSRSRSQKEKEKTPPTPSNENEGGEVETIKEISGALLQDIRFKHAELIRKTMELIHTMYDKEPPARIRQKIPVLILRCDFNYDRIKSELEDIYSSDKINSGIGVRNKTTYLTKTLFNNFNLDSTEIF